MSAHSALGPSGAHRWKACSGSVNAERLIRLANPDADTSSVFAEEGTRAHELAETLLLNPELPLPGDEIDTMDDVDMLRHCLRYRDYCQGVAPVGSQHFVEERVTMPRVDADCFGTADYVAYDAASKHLHVVDLKYGAGQFVEVKENPQAMLYAEGARQMMVDRFGIKPRGFIVHIFQPRAMAGENIGSYQFSNTRLDDFVTETAAQALATRTDIDSFSPGDKQCHWCLANPCKAREQQMQDLFAGEFEDLEDGFEGLGEYGPLLSDEDVSRWLAKAAALKAFISRIEAIAYQRAMDHTPIPGFKLVEGRGSYRPNEKALEFILGDDMYKERTLRSMTELKRHIGVKQFDELLKPYYQRIPGKPTLVPQSDRRKPWQEVEDLEQMLEDLS